MTSLYNLLFGGIGSNRTNAETKNTSAEIMYLDQMLNISMSRFKWNGLPEKMVGKDWYIEKMLALFGCVVLFRESDSGKLVILKGMGVGQPTLFGEFTEYAVYGDNGFTRIIPADDCVVCWDNGTHTPMTGMMLGNFADRVAEVQRVCDVRLKHHKAPVILTGTQKLLSSIKRFWKKMDDNESHIIVTEGFDPSNIIGQVVYDTGFINNDLQTYKKNLMSEFYAMQGINYNPADAKKERLITNEVDSNNEQVLQARMVHLEQRKQFCEAANKKFGLSMSCEYSLQDRNMDGKIDETEVKVEEVDGNV